MELTRNHLYKGDLYHVQYTTKSFQWERLKWLCSEIFFKYHVGKLLAKCNGMKEKGVSPVSLLRYKLSNIFVGRSMYMQQQTGSFKEAFSKDWQVFDSFYYGYAGFFKKQANRRTTLFQKAGQLFREYGFPYISMIQLRN